MKYTELTNLTFPTYPIITTEKYENINLEEKAIEYKKILNKKELENSEKINNKQNKNIFENVKDFFDIN